MPEGEAIIIGAGIGGLASAALLAARGVPVTVCEAMATPGGKLREVIAGAQAIDGGPTVFTMRGVFEELFFAAGACLEDEVPMRQADLLARHAWGADRLDLFADTERSAAAVADFAGGREAEGFRAFMAEAAHIHRTLDRPFLRATKTNPIGLTWRMGWKGFADLNSIRPYQTLWSALGDHFRDPRLKQLFGRYATYAGSSPFRCPATLMLIAAVEASGVWLVEGGMHRLAQALERVATRHGARFRYGAPVAEIIVERSRVAGVRLANGERLPASQIICNADPAALASGCFGNAARRAIGATRPRDRSLSALVWTALVQPSGFPLVRHNVFFSVDYPAEFAALCAGRVPDDPTIYVCAQDRDDVGNGAPENGERVQIIMNAPAGGDAATPTQSEIDRWTDRMLATLSRSGLALNLSPAHSVLTTPTGFNALFPRTGGALYGRASHGWAASFRRPGARTRIPGLYLAGGGTHPGAGVPMAALSGRLAALALLHDRASTSASTRKAMPGGISTPSAMTDAMG